MSNPPPYDPNQQPQYGNPPPAPQWNAPGAPGYSQPGTFDPQAGAYAPQAGAFDPQSGAHAPAGNAFDPQTGRSGQSPVKKNRTGLWIGIGALVLLLVCGVCGGLGWWVYTQTQKDRVASPPAASSEHTIVYQVTGTGQAAVTWSTGGEISSVEQATVTLPWTLEIGTDRARIGLNIVASARGDDAKLDGCVITVDGQKLVSKDSTGTNRVVSCTTFFVE